MSGFPPANAADCATAAALDDALLRRRAARYATRNAASEENPTPVLVFTRGLGRYAIPLESLREIRPLRTIAAIPGASAVVPGVFHHRGEILSAHDLEAFMGGGPGETTPAWVLVVENRGDRVGLMADEVIGVEPVTGEQVRPVPLTLGERGACLAGIVRREVMLLEPGALFKSASFFHAFPSEEAAP